jgi:hypothetical protein
MVKSAKVTMNQVSNTIGHLETELKTNEEYKSKVIREIETRGQEVIDMVKNATEVMIKIVNANESKERTRFKMSDCVRDLIHGYLCRLYHTINY